jgi:replicative DNA helicase
MTQTKVKQLPTAYAPPCNPEAEQAVLGALILRPDALHAVAAMLTPGDFYREAHGVIYQAILDLDRDGKPIDLVTVNGLLKERGQLDKVGGTMFLAALSDQVGFAVNAESYAGIVADKARLRRFIDKAQELTQACFQPVEDVSAFLNRACTEVCRVAEASYENHAVPLVEAAQAEINVLEKMHYLGTLPGLDPGFRDLAKLYRWNPSELIVLAARPGMGKTTLAANFILKAAQQGVPGGFFILEMGKEALSRRFLSIMGRVNSVRLNLGRMAADEWRRLYHAQEAFESLPIWIDDTPSLSISDLRARARRKHAEGRLGFLVVDYLQLTKPVNRGRSREEEVAEVSRGLKALAKELKIPVLAVASLNRELEKRPKKRPILSDLRESGAIEFDADAILFLYRDEVYRPDTPDKGVAELELAKHRNGPTGMVKLAYQESCYRFEDLALDHSGLPF